jgi:S1-C subfamily serine protease
MSIRVICPECGAANPVSDNMVGRRIRCRRCDEIMIVDDDHDLPDRPARRRRRRKRSSAAAAVAATVAVVIILLFVSVIVGYIVLSRPSPQHPDGVADDGDNGNGLGMPPESALMARDAGLEAYFRTPEEPPTERLEFTEPPLAEPAGGPPKPLVNTTNQMPPDVVNRIKASTAYIEVRLSGGVGGSGSGFLVAEPGFVVTNAHVVHMLVRGSPPPDNIKVVLFKGEGEKKEITLQGKVVAVDPDADLAVVSVPKDNLPPLLTIRSAETMHETQPLFVAGFPLGETGGSNVKVNQYILSSLQRDKKGTLDMLQIQGQMKPGNSGGPVLDGDGNVIGVCVAGILRTDINFAIPSDKVSRFLEGRLADFNIDPPSSGDSGLRVPVSAKLVDPLGRVRQVAIDYWMGKPGAGRPGSRTPPAAQPGDEARQTLTLDVQRQAAKGELKLPALPAGQAYWVQPSLVNRSGSRVWLSAQVYKAPPAVERKPARLAWDFSGERKLLLERWSSVEYEASGGQHHRALVGLETRFTDTGKGGRPDSPSIYRQFTSFKEGVSLEGEVRMTQRLRYLGPNIQSMANTLAPDAQGVTQRDEMDLAKRNGAPQLARPHFNSFQQDVQKFLKALEVPLPGREVKPGEEWTGHQALPIDGAWKFLNGGFSSTAWSRVENETPKMTYTFWGMRKVDGTKLAVVLFKGRADGQGQGGVAPSQVSGTLLFDPAKGQLVEEQLTAVADADTSVRGSSTIKVTGTVVARLRRE